MKQINYTGSSKLISRIVSLLNRKAPLPLDGNGDPDWGTNGQVLTTDGNGSTSWSSGGGGGDSVSWTQTQLSGDKIAEIDINGTSTDVYAPSNPTVNDGTLTIQQNGTTVGTFTANQSGDTTVNLTGGGSGGHTIEDSAGTSMTQRAGLQFVGATVTDDSVDDRTVVTIPQGTTYTEGDGIDISAQNEISVDTTFTEASTRANIASGDTFSTILGKIKKFFTDLKTVAFTGAYSDLTGTPTIPPDNSVKDYNNNTPTKFGYSTSGMAQSAATWLGAWDASVSGEYRLRAVKQADLNVNYATSATKATQDADGNDIRNKYVNIYNSWDIGRLSTVTVNDLANQGSAVAMINAATDNPIGGAKWVHVWSQAWKKGVNTSWVSQLAMGVENSTGLWYRTGSGTIVGRAWKRVIDSDTIGSQSVNYATSAGSATTASRLAFYQNNYLVTARTSWQTFTLTASSNIVSAMICPAGRQGGTPHFWIEFSGKTATIHYKNDTDYSADGYTIWLMF